MIPSHQLLSQLNVKGLTADYAELVAVYERTGILDRPRLERIGSACSVNYVFQPIFSSFGQEMEDRFTLLGWRLLQTRITVLRLALQLSGCAHRHGRLGFFSSDSHAHQRYLGTGTHSTRSGIGNLMVRHAPGF